MSDKTIQQLIAEEREMYEDVLPDANLGATLWRRSAVDAALADLEAQLAAANARHARLEYQRGQALGVFITEITARDNRIKELERMIEARR